MSPDLGLVLAFPPSVAFSGNDTQSQLVDKNGMASGHHNGVSTASKNHTLQWSEMFLAGYLGYDAERGA